MPNFPVALINYAVYGLGENEPYLGMADLTLPDIQHEIASIKGATVAGTVDHPVIGHVGDMTAVFNFHVPNRHAVRFLQARGRQIEARGALEEYDSGAGSIDPTLCRIVMHTLPRGLTLGSFEVAAVAGTSATLTVVALTIYLGDERVFEVDKFNIKYEVDGTDYLGPVRSLIGLGA